MNLRVVEAFCADMTDPTQIASNHFVFLHTHSQEQDPYYRSLPVMMFEDRSRMSEEETKLFVSLNKVSELAEKIHEDIKRYKEGSRERSATLINILIYLDRKNLSIEKLILEMRAKSSYLASAKYLLFLECSDPETFLLWLSDDQFDKTRRRAQSEGVIVRIADSTLQNCCLPGIIDFLYTPHTQISPVPHPRDDPSLLHAVALSQAELKQRITFMRGGKKPRIRYLLGHFPARFEKHNPDPIFSQDE